MNRSSTKAGIVAAIAFILVLCWFGLADAQKAVSTATPWINPIVSPGEIEAIKWIGNNTPPGTTVMYDIFGGETMMALALRTPPVGGDWTTSPDAVQRMGEVTQFYKTNSSSEASSIAVRLNASFVIVPSRQLHCGFNWLQPVKEKFEDQTYFKKVFENGDTKIYAVLSATPATSEIK